jgi:hypothetical protein
MFQVSRNGQVVFSGSLEQVAEFAELDEFDITFSIEEYGQCDVDGLTITEI